MPALTFPQVTEILARAGDALQDVVLVGGQAVNFWAEYYIARCPERVPELLASAPFTSKDVDFQADRNAVKKFASRLCVKPELPELGDATLSSGRVTFAAPDGSELSIDFLGHAYGMDLKDVIETSIPFELGGLEGDAGSVTLRVMHPERCLESRVKNCVELPGYRTEHAIKQLRASLTCTREFISDLLEGGEARAAINLCKRIFTFCRDDFQGRLAHLEVGVDPFDAVRPLPEMPELFRTRHYPQMRRALEARRLRLKPRL